MSEKTRLKITVLFLGAAILEALIRTFLQQFPLTELYSFEALLYGGYIAVKTISNIDEAKYANGVKK